MELFTYQTNPNIQTKFFISYTFKKTAYLDRLLIL